MMKQNFLSLASLACAFSLLTACNSGSDKNGTATSDSTSTTTGTEEAGGSDTKGIGKFKNVELTHPLDEKMVASGQNVYNVKCASCHKTTDEKLVGPGWKGVTDRRTPEWIMNFVTNTEEMIDKDTAAQKMLEQCLVRMPNQSLNDQDARDVLEFMRKNDGKN
jgi:mono/diheme cytochrome c family protein